MAAVNETIVREYFELHEFLVRQHRKYVSTTRNEDDDIDFFVLNPAPSPLRAELPFVLSPTDLEFIAQAIVVVKGWHTEAFSPSVLACAPAIFRFAEPKAFRQAARAFGKDATPLKILVVSALPQDATARDQSVALLKSKGIDAVIPFRTILSDLIAHIESNRNYVKSDLLQMIRVLKAHDLLKEPQLDLFKGRRRRSGVTRS